MESVLPLKWLVAFCVLECVGATALPLSPALFTSPPTPPPPKAPAVCGNPKEDSCVETPGPKEQNELHQVRLQRIHPIARLRAC